MYLLIATTAAILVVGLGLFHRSLRAIPAEWFGHLREGIDAGAASIADLRARLFVWVERLFDNEDIQGSERVGYGFGALFNAGCFGIFVLAEFYIMALTLGALGFSHGDVVEPPLSVEILTGIALVGPAIFFGFVLMDLVGMTNIAPWRRLRLGWRLAVGAFCVAGIGTAFVLAGAMGLYRAVALNDPAPVAMDWAATSWDDVLDADVFMGEFLPSEATLPDVRPSHAGVVHFDAASEVLPYVVMGVLPVYLMAASVLAGVGVVFLSLYAVASFVWLMAAVLWPILVIFAVARVGVNVVWGTLDAILSLAARIGIAMARPAVTLLRGVQQVPWSEASAARRLLLALAAAANDVEIPNEGIGDMAVLPAGRPAANAEPSAPAAGSGPEVDGTDSDPADVWDDAPPSKPAPDGQRWRPEQGNGEWRDLGR